MAVTKVLSGALNLTVELKAALGGDFAGTEIARVVKLLTFTDSGGTEPDLATFLVVESLDVTGATSYLLAAAAAPFGSYMRGLAPAAGVDKVKAFYVENLHASASIALIRKTAGGLTLFDTATAGLTIPAGAFVLMSPHNGGAALTTTSNDGITITPSAGTVPVKIIVGYGP